MVLLEKLGAFASALSKKPPKTFDPTCYPTAGFWKKWADTARAEGPWGAYRKLRMESVFRVGYQVGTDANGNKYFENPDYRKKRG